MNTLALAAMRAEELAISSPEYEALADAVGYALDLADFAHAAEIHVFARSGAPRRLITQPSFSHDGSKGC